MADIERLAELETQAIERFQRSWIDFMDMTEIIHEGRTWEANFKHWKEYLNSTLLPQVGLDYGRFYQYRAALPFAKSIRDAIGLELPERQVRYARKEMSGKFSQEQICEILKSASQMAAKEGMALSNKYIHLATSATMSASHDPNQNPYRFQELVAEFLKTAGYNVERNVKTPVGFADIVTDTFVAEVKIHLHINAFQLALGQVLLYRAAIDPNLQAWIIFKPSINQDVLPLAKMAYEHYGVVTGGVSFFLDGKGFPHFVPVYPPHDTLTMPHNKQLDLFQENAA